MADEPSPMELTSRERETPVVQQYLTPEQQREYKRRTRNRALATAIVLAALVVLIFALAIAKIHAGWQH